MSQPERHRRRHSEHDPDDPDPRTHPQRDRDRILYSTAFRRLAGVTQVVTPAAEVVLTHNRLTHSLKVAQLARRMAERLVRDEDQDRLASVGGLDPDVAEAAALAHDLGHPPFGHVGEDALDDILVDKAKTEAIPIDGFEGNPQSFRVVTKLARMDKDFAGLDLTRATLNAILKYPWKRAADPEAYEHKKWGAYPSEDQDFAFAREHEGTVGVPGAEAALMDWADDISYAIHDFDDFYRSGLIDLSQLLDDIQANRELLLRAGRRLQKKSPYKYDDTKWVNTVARVEQDLRADEWALLRRPFGGKADQRGVLHKFTSKLITRYVDAVRLGNVQMPVWVDEDTWHEVNFWKELTWQYVINRPVLATVQRGQHRLILNLFEAITEWVVKEEEARIPMVLQEMMETAKLDQDVPATTPEEAAMLQNRAIADFIALLSESQAIGLHRELTGGAQMSVLGTWIR